MPGIAARRSQPLTRRAGAAGLARARDKRGDRYGPGGPTPEAVRWGAATSSQVMSRDDFSTGVALDWRGGLTVSCHRTFVVWSSLAARKPCTQLRHAGTLLCDPGLSATARHGRCAPLPWWCREPSPVTVDRDEVLLIEDWRRVRRQRPHARDRRAGHHRAVYTVNGRVSFDITGGRQRTPRGFASSTAASAM